MTNWREFRSNDFSKLPTDICGGGAFISKGFSLPLPRNFSECTVISSPCLGCLESGTIAYWKHRKVVYRVEMKSQIKHSIHVVTYGILAEYISLRIWIFKISLVAYVLFVTLWCLIMILFSRSGQVLYPDIGWPLLFGIGAQKQRL